MTPQDPRSPADHSDVASIIEREMPGFTIAAEPQVDADFEPEIDAVAPPTGQPAETSPWAFVREIPSRIGAKLLRPPTKTSDRVVVRVRSKDRTALANAPHVDQTVIVNTKTGRVEGVQG